VMHTPRRMEKSMVTYSKVFISYALKRYCYEVKIASFHLLFSRHHLLHRTGGGVCQSA
jgi:hypothetical protein